MPKSTDSSCLRLESEIAASAVKKDNVTQIVSFLSARLKWVFVFGLPNYRLLWSEKLLKNVL